MKMIAGLGFLVFLSTGCVGGTYLRENMTRLSVSEGILISGGDATDISVEVFVPSTGHSCLLPSLPDERYRHTMNGLLICGGMYDYSATTCLSFISGQWIPTHTLVEERYSHTSWQTEQGLVIMGGQSSPNTSEIVATAGEQGGPSFAMQHSTENACSMPDLTSDSVIITGGWDSMSTVSRYGVLGWVEDLPSLVVGRKGHACGLFLRGDTQVFLIAGGRDANWDLLSSTEVMTMDSPGWTLTTPLPRAMEGVRGVTLGGIFYLTGGSDAADYRYEIFCWLEDKQEWEEIGKMKKVRSFHAVTTIQMDDQAMEHCV